jgi:crotonobetainyl-CoA:carnitine CoA-transferase CaiB-like acyl-CoA transferase
MATNLPLAGIRVLDCSRVYAGPIASMILGDLGADVWKVEPPNGDETRGWGPPYWGDPADRRSAYFASVNRNKRSLVVNLKTDAGRALLDRLADQCDILLHNYQPSVAASLGLDAARLQAEHPRLVVATIGGFPGDGDAAERPAYDLVAQAVSGLMSVTGDPHGGPMKVGVALLDLTAGLQAAIAALSGLVARERGRADGQHASVSLIEAGVASLTNVLGHHLATGEEPHRWGTGHPDIVPYQVFAARDGHVVVAVGNDRQFERLLRVLGMEPDPRFATNEDRLAVRDELVTQLAVHVGEWARDELVRALSDADVPAGPVNSVSEALAAMEAAHDGQWTQAADGLRLAPSPIRVDGARLPLRAAPPRFAGDTDEVLTEAGLTRAEIAALRAAGAIGPAG